jgi:hypothetical protein
MTDIFNGETNTETENYIEEFVGEGKKFKSVEELAKAYKHANSHIPELQTELQNTREFIASKLDELATQRQAAPNGQTEETRITPNPDPVAPPNAEGEDLETRIAKILEQKSTQERAQANADLAQDVLVEQLGSVEDAIKAVNTKAQELGVSPQFLKETAFSSPKAFFNLMGIDPEVKPKSSTTPNSSSDVNPRMLDRTNPIKQGTYGYYEQLRKSDPKKYWSPNTQRQLMKDAQENPGFFN